MKKCISLLAVMLLVLGVFTACSKDEQTPAPKSDVDYNELLGALAPTENPSMSSFQTVDLDGNTVDESIFEGYDLTMVNIWATFCDPCIGEMPDLAEINAEYADKKVQVIGIIADVYGSDGKISDKQMDAAFEIIEKTGANYTHLLPSDDLQEGKLNTVSAVPETIFLDSTGKQVVDPYLGARDKDEWTAIIDVILEAAVK